MDLVRFLMIGFFIIIVTSKIELKKFRLVADASQHFAVGLHGLGQVLDDGILHNIITSKVELKKF